MLAAESRLPVGSSARIRRGFGHQRPGDGDPLHLSTRQLGGLVLPSIEQLDEAQHALGALRDHGRGPAVEQQGQRDVLLRGQIRQQVEELEDEADLAPPEERGLVVAQLGQAVRADRDLAGRERRQAGRDVQDGALAGAARSHDRAELALGHGEREVAQDLHLRRALTEGLRDVLEMDHRALLPGGAPLDGSLKRLPTSDSTRSSHARSVRTRMSA